MAFRNRVQWCWGIHPVAPPVGRRMVMTGGTYMAYGWCLAIAIDGDSGEVLS